MTKLVFAYFTSAAAPDGEQVRFARNLGDTPLEWQPLRGGAPVLTSTVGRCGVRDPFLLRAEGRPEDSARFYLLATDMRAHGNDTAEFWEHDQQHGSRSIVVWESDDLLGWSAARLLQVAPPTAGNAWAPEAVYDRARQCYALYWASTLHQPGEDTRGRSHNRMLIATTHDFRTVGEASVWIDPGWSVIDATVVMHNGWWYRFSKDERSPASDTHAAKFITLERSRDLCSTAWELVADGIGASRDGAPGLVHGEGPVVVPPQSAGEPWYLFIDEFGLRGYVPVTSDGIEGDDWHAVDSYSLPAGASHGSILAISDEEWARLDHWNEPANRPASGHADSGDVTC